MKHNPNASVKSATRVLDILELVARAESAPTFSDIADTLGIPNSSLFYLLNTLKARGYLDQQGERNSYVVGSAVDLLSASGVQTKSWRQMVPALLDHITGTINETSTFAEQRGDEVECLEIRLASQTLVPLIRSGRRSPLYAFSGGKVLLANMPDEAINGYFSRTQFKRLTVNTLVNTKALWREIQETRLSGIGYSRDEHTLGVTGVSVALRVKAQVVGTIGVAIPTVRFSRQIHSTICKLLTSAAANFAATTSSSSAPARQRGNSHS